MIFRVLLSFFAIPLSLNIFCQTAKLSGKILNSKNDAMANANVMLLQAKDQLIVNFTITDGFGKFEIENTGIDDSLVLKITAFDFKDTTVMLVRGKTFYEIILLEKPIVLEEVLVKANTNPINSSNDTINYKTKAFAQGGDRVLSDVLKNMPGIQVNENGKIKFNGEDISDFYIDGKNMLDNNYQLATTNLNYNHIEEVQVLTNHKSKKLQDSAFGEGTTAINLKLTEGAKGKLIGQLSLATGITPLLYEGEITAFKFAKKMQLLTGFKLNNSGRTFSASQLETISIVNRIQSTTSNDKEKIIGIREIRLPPIKSQRYTFNESQVAFFTWLKMLNSETKITINTSGLASKESNDAVSNTQIFLPNNTIRLDEITNNIQKYSGMTTKLNVERNAKRFYFINTTNVIINQVKKLGQIKIDNLIKQKFSQPFIQFSNKFELNHRINNRIYAFNSSVNYNNNIQGLKISPGQFDFALNQSLPYQLLQQDMRLQNFNFSNMLSFTTVKNRKTLNCIFGQEYIDKTLSSGIYKNYINIDTKLNDSFANQLNWIRNRLFANPSLSYKKDKMEMNCDMLLDFSTLKMKNFGKLFINKSYLFLNPSIDIKYRIGLFNSLNLNASKTNTISDITTQYLGFVITDYRNMYNNDSVVQESNTNNIGSKYNFANPLKGLFGNIETQYSHIKHNTIQDFTFNNTAATLRNLKLTNYRKHLSFSTNIEKYYFKSKLTTGLQLGYENANSNFIQQNQLLSFQKKMKSIGVKLNVWVLKRVQLAWSSNFNYTNNTLNIQKSKNNTAVHSLKFNYKLSKNIMISNIFDYYKFSNSNSKTNNLFADIFMTYKSKKIDIDFVVQNIANQTKFTSFILNSNFSNITQLNIRPLNVMVRMHFTF